MRDITFSDPYVTSVLIVRDGKSVGAILFTGSERRARYSIYEKDEVRTTYHLLLPCYATMEEAQEAARKHFGTHDTLQGA